MKIRKREGKRITYWKDSRKRGSHVEMWELEGKNLQQEKRLRKAIKVEKNRENEKDGSFKKCA